MSEPHKRASVQGCRAAVATLQWLCCPFAVSTLCTAAVQYLELGEAVKDVAKGRCEAEAGQWVAVSTV